ncbi:MAG: c-type cytochrome [Nitrospiraceae bacterium]|nr:c-type cytochrome [Nitrospiraceae bacterium]
MNKKLASLILSTAVLLPFPVFAAMKGETPDPGAALFRANCAACHPNGGNIMNPRKTLHKKDRVKNGIITADDIIRKMRNPGPSPTHPQDWAGMKMFDEQKISNADARRIAQYILKTFE